MHSAAVSRLKCGLRGGVLSVLALRQPGGSSPFGTWLRPEFETHPTLVPGLDGTIPAGPIAHPVNQLIRFERGAFQAAKVRNASTMGSQFLFSQKSVSSS